LLWRSRSTTMHNGGTLHLHIPNLLLSATHTTTAYACAMACVSDATAALQQVLCVAVI
jgi:hypothetical protein